MATRSIPAEQQAITQFNQNYGKLPSTPQEWAVVHKYAYPTINDLPDEFKNELNLTMYGNVPASSKAGPPAVNPTQTTPQQKETSAIAGMPKDMQDVVKQSQEQQDYLKSTPEYQQREAAAGNIPSPAAMGETLRAIQAGIKTKMGYGSAPIDTSTLFQAAGLTGFENLHQALTQRAQELKDHSTTLENVLTETGGIFKGLADTAKQNWDIANQKYQEAASTLQKSMDDMRANERAIAMANLNHKLSLQLEQYKLDHPSPTEQLNALSGGYMIQNGQLVPDTDLNRGIVGGFNIGVPGTQGAWATNPQHLTELNSVYNSIGKLNTLDDVTAYIKKVAPGSPITAEMISQTSQKYGIPWEMLLAVMMQDSTLGTRGKAVPTYNPGNVGNTDSGATRNYGNWQAGVDAVGELLNKRRIDPSTIRPGEVQLSADDERTARDLSVGKLTFQQFTSLYPSRAGKDQKRRNAVYNYAMALNPNFSPATFEAGQRLAISPTTYQAISSIDTVLPNIDKVIQLSDEFKRGGMPAVNHLLASGKFQIGDKVVTTLEEAQKLLGDEMGNALGKGTMSDMKLSLGLDLTKATDVSPENFLSKMDLVKGFLLNRRTAMLAPLGQPGANIYGAAPTSGGTNVDLSQFDK